MMTAIYPTRPTSNVTKKIEKNYNKNCFLLNKNYIKTIPIIIYSLQVLTPVLAGGLCQVELSPSVTSSIEDSQEGVPFAQIYN